MGYQATKIVNPPDFELKSFRVFCGISRAELGSIVGCSVYQVRSYEENHWDRASLSDEQKIKLLRTYSQLRKMSESIRFIRERAILGISQEEMAGRLGMTSDKLAVLEAEESAVARQALGIGHSPTKLESMSRTRARCYQIRVPDRFLYALAGVNSKTAYSAIKKGIELAEGITKEEKVHYGSSSRNFARLISFSVTEKEHAAIKELGHHAWALKFLVEHFGANQ